MDIMDCRDSMDCTDSMDITDCTDSTDITELYWTAGTLLDCMDCCGWTQYCMDSMRCMARAAIVIGSSDGNGNGAGGGSRAMVLVAAIVIGSSMAGWLAGWRPREAL